MRPVRLALMTALASALLSSLPASAQQPAASIESLLNQGYEVVGVGETAVLYLQKETSLYMCRISVYTDGRPVQSQCFRIN